jgi:cell division protein FtsL
MSMRAPAAPAAPTFRPRRAPAPTPVPKPGTRQQPSRVLRVVRPGELSAQARKRRARLAATFTLCLIGAGLFATVAFHVVLTQNQFRLERLRDQATEEQARYQRLRLQVAELESPARIVATAQDRLGMVQPTSIAYLAPQAPNTMTSTPSSSSSTPEATPTTDQRDWSDVKSQLAAHP